MALIYIVEDDINIREIETFSLKNSGYQIKDFGCAADFYAKMQEKLPNLIILDVMLPDEDGLSIVKKLRSNPESRKIPVIMVTAKTTELDKVKGLDLGADDYLTKPFSVNSVNSVRLNPPSGPIRTKTFSLGLTNFNASLMVKESSLA